MLGYTNDQQNHHECHLMTLGVQVRLLISRDEYVQRCCEVHTYAFIMVYKLTKLYTNDT
jgi:hypothetical protein